jgi:transcriptional regulator with XRE-family HTH domain
MPTTVAQLCQEQQVALDELVRRSGLEESRVQAIIEGRWTPSPDERRRIAAALNAPVEEIVWGHKTPIQHLWGHGPT